MKKKIALCFSYLKVQDAVRRQFHKSNIFPKTNLAVALDRKLA